MKAWTAQNDWTGIGVVVFAETRGQARALLLHSKWRVRKKHKPDEYGTEEEWFCKYLGRFDSELGCGLLWDACKECGEHYDDERYANKCAKWRYKHRDYIAKIEAEWRDRYERNQDA